MKRILLGDEKNIRMVYPAATLAALIEDDAEPHIYTKEEVLASPVCDAEYLFTTWGMPHFTCEEIRSSLPKLKAVFYAAGSVQGFAKEFLACGVRVFSAWGANAVPVAEYTVSQIILANKGFFSVSDISSPEGYRDAARRFAAYRGNYGCHVGLIGVGMIGSLVARMLSAYNLRVMVYDPFLSDEAAAALGVERVSLETLFSECEVISNHLANNAATRGMLNHALFSRMKPTAAFINTGRGAQVVEADLARALAEVPTRVALLDVTDPEPPTAESPLYTLPNVILTPHIAGSAGDEVHRMSAYMLDEYRALTNGAPVKYEVTERMLTTMA